MFVEMLFRNPMYFASVVIIVVLSITVHEFFHAWAAYWQGDDTAARAGRLTLDPRAHMGTTALVLLLLVGVTWGSTPVNRSRLRYAFSPGLVAFAGPFANGLLMVFAISLGLGFQRMGWGSPGMVDVLSLMALLNAFLMLLNLLPIPPLDGFEILETFLPPLRRYAMSLNQYGFFILMVLFFFFGFSGLMFQVARWMVWKVSLFLVAFLPTL